MDLGIRILPAGTAAILCSLRSGWLIEGMHTLALAMMVREHLRTSPTVRTIVLSLEGATGIAVDAVPPLLRLQEELLPHGLIFALCKPPADVLEFMEAIGDAQRFRFFSEDELAALAAE